MCDRGLERDELYAVFDEAFLPDRRVLSLLLACISITDSFNVPGSL